MTGDSVACTWKSDADRKRDMRRRKIERAKDAVRMWCHKWFWRTLWATRLGRPYSRMMCRKGWYRKFPDGRCMYCGKGGRMMVGKTRLNSNGEFDPIEWERV